MIGASPGEAGEVDLPGNGAGGEECGADTSPGEAEDETEIVEPSCEDEPDDGETGAGGDGSGVGSGDPGVGGGTGVGSGGGSAAEPDRTATTGAVPAVSTAVVPVTRTVLPSGTASCIGGECEPISFAKPAAILPMVTTAAAGLELRGTAPAHVPELAEPASSAPVAILVSAVIVVVLATGGVLILRRVRARF